MSATVKQQRAPDVELWRIAESGDVGELTRVFANGAHVNARNKHGMTALMKASSNGHARMVRALLERGADPNLVRNDKFTALALAAFFGHTETVKILMEHGARPEVLTRSGTSAQTWATRRTCLEAARCLESPASKRTPEPPPALVAVSAIPNVLMKTTLAFRLAAVVVVSVACVVGVLVLRKSQASSMTSGAPAKQPAVATQVSPPVDVENTKTETPVEESTPEAGELSHHPEPSSVQATPARKVVLTRQNRTRAISEEPVENARIVQSTETPAAAPVIASPQVQPRRSAASQPNTSLSPQLIAPAKSAPPKGKVIQWP